MESEMPCPTHGIEYVTIGERKVCPKCGHTLGYKQIDIVQILRENEQLRADVAFYKQRWLESPDSD